LKIRRHSSAEEVGAALKRAPTARRGDAASDAGVRGLVRHIGRRGAHLPFGQAAGRLPHQPQPEGRALWALLAHLPKPGIEEGGRQPRRAVRQHVPGAGVHGVRRIRLKGRAALLPVQVSGRRHPAVHDVSVTASATVTAAITACATLAAAVPRAAALDGRWAAIRSQIHGYGLR